MADPKTLSPREVELAILAWRALPEDVKVDLEKFKDLGGLKNTSSTRVTWNNLKKKLFSGQYVSPIPVSTPVKNRAPATNDKKRPAPKAAKIGGSEDEDDWDLGESPYKRARPENVRDFVKKEAAKEQKMVDSKVKMEEDEAQMQYRTSQGYNGHSSRQNNSPGI